MKYHVYAKILGDFLPSEGKRLTINDCVIEKDKSFSFVLKDMPRVPVYDPSSMYHIVEQGVRCFIQYPQSPISTRYFESMYFISTVIEEDNLYHLLDRAEKRFMQTISILSIAVRTTMRQVGKRRIRGREYYDFEIFGIYVKRKGKLIRIKAPEPLISGHNYFPRPLPPRFTSKAKKMLREGDDVFKKGLEYITRASRMRNSGNFRHLEMILNLIKCIELVSKSVGGFKVRDRKTKKLRDPYTKELFQLAGKKLRVPRDNWRFAQDAWTVRNKGDVAHQSIWDWRAFPLSYDSLDEAANMYLLKYFAWVGKGRP